MTNAELQEALDEFGGHLEVIVRSDRGDAIVDYPDLDVDTGDYQGATVLVISI